MKSACEIKNRHANYKTYAIRDNKQNIRCITISTITICKIS